MKCLSLMANRTFSSNTIIDPSFGLTNSAKQLQSMAHQFAINEFRPYMRQWDEESIFPREQLRKCAQLGFGAMYVPVEDGGTGLSRLETSVIIEALSQGCVPTTAMLSIHNMCVGMLSKYGSTELKSRIMSPLVNFDLMASYCLTEPSSGSDAAGLLTKATKKDDHYVLNGTKAFISGGGESDVYFIMCRTGGPGSKGISCILVEKGTKGLSFGKLEKKLGWTSQPTRAVILEECKVPISNLLGEENRGFNYAMDGINGGRLNIASCSLGAAQWAMEEAIAYSLERKQFNKLLIEFQNTQFKLANFASELLASRLLVRAAASRLDEESQIDSSENEYDNKHISIPPLCAAGKLFATEKCFTIIDGCLQLLGGYGYLHDFPVQQLLRDSRVHRILEGTNEVMQLIISKDFF
ncbi:hypothetical protein RDWZM_000650 [Blomia tropicalis]|uniref:Isobutyryl-CoA dehydrogenase, mitochondrial n=1 Tax=Blomia tropicalis TaxID=40697 RepID=A0A9Q0MA87_BLOTA|nr:hypothetical protein RDWZM_000650 [Blomia tropicalis]